MDTAQYIYIAMFYLQNSYNICQDQKCMLLFKERWKGGFYERYSYRVVTKILTHKTYNTLILLTHGHIIILTDFTMANASAAYSHNL